MTAASRAGCAVVRVPAHALMFRIDIVLVAVLVAGGAAECTGVVRGVTLVACVPFILESMFRAAVNRESRGCVHVVRRTERRRRGPDGLRVTNRAIVIEIHRNVIRRCRGGTEVRLMALVAIRIRDLIIAVDVASQAGRRCVRAL